MGELSIAAEIFKREWLRRSGKTRLHPHMQFVKTAHVLFLGKMLILLQIEHFKSQSSRLDNASSSVPVMLQ